MARQNPTVEQVIDRIASSAKGVVTIAELLHAGLTKDEIRHRREIGYLIPKSRGVYRVGHRAPNFETSYLAAGRHESSVITMIAARSSR